MDWEDLKTFLAVARHGSLSAGARALAVSQATMGRRLDALHARIGAKLLQRTPSGFALTPAGERILASVERMEFEANSVERTIGGEDVRLEGLVRVTTVETFGARIVVPALAGLQTSHPGIVVELITDTRSLSLARREADIAIRLAPFEQHAAVVSHIADMAFGLYAADAYLAAHGTPDLAVEGGAGHRLINFQDDLSGLAEATWIRRIAPKATPALKANSRDVQLNACVAGFGLAALPRYLADAVVGLRLLPTAVTPPVREVWLGVHKDMRATPRIRAVLEAVTTGIRAQARALSPRAGAHDQGQGR
ncbi:LysR family transcriptional regulator [Phenylobacterium immobile]|uniref:LysR family transcriptional regulator n=1 Tax=Phenylobacterium immobile TaxID=21 RepID=UPI000B2447F0|nr:LysR family transcriptional regulator [Phenylobacterium immobile]